MSGHSKWANIKRRKESQDQKRGQLFSKFAKAITIAVKEGGSADPASNSHLRMLIEQARAVNMPKENIQRALSAGQQKDTKMESFVLEGYGPFGIAILVEVATDNRQRSIQEIKNVFQHSEGSLVEPGSVSFQFDRRGVVTTKKAEENKILELMDFGIDDFEEKDEELVFYLAPEKLEEFKKFAQDREVEVISSDLVMKPKNRLSLEEQKHERAERFLEELQLLDDVQRVFSNIS
jgi:YebC/PmpR family DNA-binding regulatory protein